MISPLATVKGKAAALESIHKLYNIAQHIRVRAQFSNENSVMLALDTDFPAPIGTLPVASLLSFKEGLISQVELFYDARPLEQKKDDIFAQKNKPHGNSCKKCNGSATQWQPVD